MNLHVNAVTKRYGSTLALNQVSVTLQPGIIGLLGANGSGKTTLMRIMVDVLEASEGVIEWDGKPIAKQREHYLSQVGYMPQHLGMYPTFRVVEFLQYMGAIKGLTKDYTDKRIKELLPLVHLEHERKKKCKALSGGMRQRLGIAQALLNDPAILILDEPTAGLDPKERNQFSNLLSDLAKDKIILLSTHIVSDVEAIANEIVIMKQGTIIAHDTPQQLLKRLQGCVKEMDLTHTEVQELRKQHIICAQRQTGDLLHVRYLDEKKQGEGILVEPTLNDLYLSYFEEEAL